MLEAAILESHGIEVPSPSCHSNGEDTEPQEFPEQVPQRFSEQVKHAHINLTNIIKIIITNQPIQLSSISK